MTKTAHAPERLDTGPGIGGFMWGVLCAVALTAPLPVLAQEPVPVDSVEAILQRYVDDYAVDPSLEQSVTFGIAIGHEHLWHVVVTAADNDEPATARLVRGAPPEPTFYFRLDYPTLVRLDRGEISGQTAMVQGLASDRAPMTTGGLPGFQPDAGTARTMLGVSFHFWTRGFPEVIPFGDAFARFVHGTDAVVLYYGQGLRTGWFSLKPGQHANSDPRLQVNPFPTLLVVTRGSGVGRIGEVERTLGAGYAILIPAGTEHEFWNPNAEPVEGLIIMFGPGA